MDLNLPNVNVRRVNHRRDDNHERPRQRDRDEAGERRRLSVVPARV